MVCMLPKLPDPSVSYHAIRSSHKMLIKHRSSHPQLSKSYTGISAEVVIVCMLPVAVPSFSYHGFDSYVINIIIPSPSSLLHTHFVLSRDLCMLPKLPAIVLIPGDSIVIRMLIKHHNPHPHPSLRYTLLSAEVVIVCMLPKLPVPSFSYHAMIVVLINIDTPLPERKRTVVRIFYFPQY